MYHIKNDKRCHKSAAHIGEALKALLEEKPLAEISVTDLQKASGVSRSTFYRLFDNVDDVLVYIIEEDFRDMIAMYKDMDWSEFTQHLIDSISAEGRGIMNVALSGKTHLVSRALRYIMTMEASMANFKFDNTSKYMIAMFIGGCISLVTAWDENGRKESIEELAGMMQQAFNYDQIESMLRRSADR